MKVRSGRWLLGVLSAVALWGCGRSTGPEMGTVTGTVTLDGQPVANLDVVFQPDSGRPSLGTTDESGRYELRYSTQKKGALVGSHSVMIAAPSPDREADPPQQASVMIPPRYNVQTELTAQVDPGRNQIDFELSSK